MRTFQGLGICDTNYRYLPLGGRLGNANQPVRGNHFPGDDALAAKFPSGGAVHPAVFEPYWGCIIFDLVT